MTTTRAPVTWLETVPDQLMMRGANPDVLGQELLAVIADAIARQPRTLQRRIGPSEVGHACARRLGYKLMGAPHLNPHRPVAWKPWIGTAVHAQLEEVFDRWDYDRAMQAPGGYQPRWLTETKVEVGEVAGEEIDGSTDLYDRFTCTVVDWKIVGPSPLKSYKAHGPGPQYRAQVHLYARGWQRRGFPIDTVMIVFLPRNDELHQTHVWHEPYDEQVALAALNRVNAIYAATTALGVTALTQLPTADAHCYRCPYFVPGSDDLRHGCPGYPSSQSSRPSTTSPALTLVGAPTEPTERNQP